MGEFKFFEILIRGIPESFIIMVAVYALCKRRIEVRRYIGSSIIFALVGYVTRMLPIQNGINTIINIFMLIVIIVNINKIELIEGIKIAILTMIMQFLSESINVLIIQYVFNVSLDYVFNSSPVIKTLYGMPSTVILGITVILYYRFLCKKKVLKYGEYN